MEVKRNCPIIPTSGLSYQSQLQGDPLTKQDILDVYSDVFTRIGKFPGMPYKFQLKDQMQSPQDMHLEKFLYTCKMPSTKKSGIWNNLGFLRRPKMSQSG